MDYRFPIAIENLLPVDIARIINCQLFQKEQFDDVINELNFFFSKFKREHKLFKEELNVDITDLECSCYPSCFIPFSLININELH